MCGRYNLTDDPATRLLMEILGIELTPLPLINIAPTESAPVVRTTQDGNVVSWMRWWLVPSWSPGPSQKYAMFNARSESVASSRAFATPFRHQRCIVPASSFIEWSALDGNKRPYLIRECERGLAFAGVWDCWGQGEGQVESFAILTREARDDFAGWHHRMPVMLSDELMESWLAPDASPEQLQALLAEPCQRALAIAPLSGAVNPARDKRPEVLEPQAEAVILKV